MHASPGRPASSFSLECELLDREPLRTQSEARMAVFDFIEGWYNPHRRHSALGYRSPNAFEREEAARGGSAPAPPLSNEQIRKTGKTC
ncbi:MAG: hypothetical protein CL908_26925, partial [Deltaproteobacteria bacterium]|nr:hypothetical protein [Deltaproteobacteria bacterium]